MEELLFKNFNSRITCNNVIIIGREDKDLIIKSLINYVAINNDHGFIYCPTSKLNNTYIDYPNVEFELSGNIVDKCMSHKHRSYLVFDDCMHIKDEFSGFNDLCINSRYYNINPLIITT